jgi:hypothetical protein
MLLYKKGGSVKKSMTCGQTKKSSRKGKKIMKLYCKDGQKKLVHAGDTKYENNVPSKRKSFKARHKCSTAAWGTPRHLACTELWAQGGILRYQTGNKLPDLKTYASDPAYFDNTAAYHTNPAYSDLIRSKVYAGTHGYDPTTGTLHKLDQPVSVAKGIQALSVAPPNSGLLYKKNPAGQELRTDIVHNSMQAVHNHPLWSAPGIIASGTIAPALGAMLSGVETAQQAQKGNYTAAAVTGGLGLLGVKGVTKNWKAFQTAKQDAKLAENILNTNKKWELEAPIVDDEIAKNFFTTLKERIKTGEGLKRAQNLGVTDTRFLDKVVMKKVDPYTNIAYYKYKPFNRGVHPYIGMTEEALALEPGLYKALIRHEWQHAIQDQLALLNKGMMPFATSMDKNLKNLTLKNVGANPNSLSYFSENVAEPSAFLAELQQMLVDKKLIANAYEKMTPAKIKKLYELSEKGKLEGFFERKVRILDIIEPTDNNFKILSDEFNKLLTTTGVVAGAETLTPKKRLGGILYKTQYVNI